MPRRPHILFDLDGTLVDPAAGIIRSVRAGLAAVGIAPPPASALQFVIGPPLRASFAELGVAPAAVERAIEAYRVVYRAGAMVEAHVYDGIAACLSDLRRDGCTLHVATSKPHVYATPILAHFGLVDHFAGIFGDELDGSRSAKADVIAHLLTTQRIEAAGCIMIGDRKHDCIGAAVHAIPTIGVTWGYGGRAELEAHGASAIATHAHDLPALIAGLQTS